MLKHKYSGQLEMETWIKTNICEANLIRTQRSNTGTQLHKVNNIFPAEFGLSMANITVYESSILASTFTCKISIRY